MILITYGCKEEGPQLKALKEYENKSGTVKLILCSNDCFQYLLEIDNILFRPDSLPDQFKLDQCPVRIDGIIQNDSSIVFKPGVKNISIPGFKVRNIKLTRIESMGF